MLCTSLFLSSGVTRPVPASCICFLQGGRGELKRPRSRNLSGGKLSKSRLTPSPGPGSSRHCPCCLLPITGRFYRNTLSVPNPRNLLTVHRKLATPLPLPEQTSFVDRPEEMLPLFEFPCLVTARQTDLPMSHICYLFSPIFKRAKILTWLSYKIPQI